MAAFHDQSRSLARGHISINTRGLSDAAHAISAALGSDRSKANADQTARLYIDILVSILSSTTGNTAYLDKLSNFAISTGSTTATLNYDLLLEDSAVRQGLSFHYGLANWNNRKLVSWKPDENRLLKLHGSINWTGSTESITVVETAPKIDRWSRTQSLLIFGGQSTKLTPHGPFLQLRHEFERELMRRNRLLIIGYSFGDEHINSVLARWVSTRKSGKMVVVEPGTINFGIEVFANSYRSDDNNLQKIIDIVHVKKTAREGMDIALNKLGSPINLSHDRQKNGYLPDIMVNVIS